MELKIYQTNGTASGKQLKIKATLVELKPHQQAMHDAIVAQQASRRQGTHQVKGRSAVSGGGRKP